MSHRAPDPRRRRTVRFAAFAVPLALSATAFVVHTLNASAAQVCMVSATLVNSCRPWLGGWAAGYAGHTSGVREQITDHETRIGRQLDIVHDYRGPGETLTADDKYYSARASTTLLLNYKPAAVWRDADGRNATVNARIDAMAESIKAVAPKKIMLILFHEPENDVDPAKTSCSVGSPATVAGSPVDYVNMWHNTRARFNAAGVTNVVWGMNYMMYPGGTCLIKPLWPGNAYVDWVFTDPYVTGLGSRPTYNQRMDWTYNALTSNSDATTNLLSKPWGFAEWGAHQMTQTQAYSVYDQAKQALSANRYPKVKAYVIFDSGSGPHGGAAVAKADNGTTDLVEQQHYTAFAKDPHFTDSFYQKQ